MAWVPGLMLGVKRAAGRDASRCQQHGPRLGCMVMSWIVIGAPAKYLDSQLCPTLPSKSWAAPTAKTNMAPPGPAMHIS